jgi:putative membrane protein
MAPHPARATDVLANERTFLAYLRTALSFIAFGFVIARFSLFTREIAGVAHVAVVSSGFSNAFGIAVSLFGTALAAFGSYRYVAADRAIFADRVAPLPVTPAIVIAGVVGAIGIAVTGVLVIVH